MNLNRAALITALSLASKVSRNVPRLPILANALLSPKGKGQVQLVASDLETFVILELPHTGEALSSPTLVPIGWLLKLLKSLDMAEVVMDRLTVNAITMSEDNYKAEDFPTVPGLRATRVEIPGLTEAMQFAYDAASVDPSRFTLNHVQVVATKKEVNINATDGHRLYRAWIAPAGVTWSGLVPASLLDIPTKKLIPADQIHYGKAENLNNAEYVALRVDGQGLTGWVMAKAVEGTFPNCESVTPKDGMAMLQLALDPAPTMQVLKQAIALSLGDRHATLDLVIRDGGFYLHPQGCSVELPVPGTNVLGPNMIIGMNGHYLRSALLNLTAPVLTLRAQEPGKPIWFTEGRGKSRRTIVIMPMRTNYTGLVRIENTPVAVESLPQTASN